MSNSEMVQPTQGDIAAQARWLGQFPDMRITPAQVERLRLEFARYRVACVAVGREEAAKVCDTYADVNFETAGDALLFDPLLLGQGFTPANMEQSQQLQTSMLIHTSYFHAGQHLAAAIRAIGEV